MVGRQQRRGILPLLDSRHVAEAGGAWALAAVARNPQQVDLFWIGTDGGVETTGSTKFDPAPDFAPPRAIAPPEAAAAGAMAALAARRFRSMRSG